MRKIRLNELTLSNIAEEWQIQEISYQPENNMYYESIFTLGNGYMAVRDFLDEGFHGKAIFPSSCIKESFTGDVTIPGIYLAGVFDNYEGDSVELINIPNFLSTKITIGKNKLNLQEGKVNNYSRILNMHQGVLIRSFDWENPSGRITHFEIKRIISLANRHIAATKYTIQPLNYSADINITSLLDGTVGNIDWGKEGLYELNEARNFHLDMLAKGFVTKDTVYLTVRTKTTKVEITEAMRIGLYSDSSTNVFNSLIKTNSQIGRTIKFRAEQSNEYIFEKIIAVFTSRDKGIKDTKQAAIKELAQFKGKRFNDFLTEHALAWEKKWDISDIVIKGSQRDQKIVRFNIFHLIQAYGENDPYISIGGRLLGSEVFYGGVLWDTEIFVLPFFIYTNPKAAKNLLLYRYYGLSQARAKAKQLWLKGAMYPWASVYDGREQCHFWEYANVEVHIIADVAYALWHYYQVTRDDNFMVNYGLEMLIETARFWKSRLWFDERIKRYTLILVQGPDEYTGPVNNDTYSLIMAGWNLKIAAEFVRFMKTNYPEKWNKLKKKLSFRDSELKKWNHINKNLYSDYYDFQKNLYIQDGNFLNRIPIDPKPLKHPNIMQRFTLPSYDTLLRYQIVKQPSMLLLMYLFSEDFTQKEKQAAWDFYEPKTIHDSSLSYNTHAIIAAELGLNEKAYEYFQKTAPLDFDRARDTDLGLHSACIGGTWQVVVNGFAGMRLEKGMLSFSPHLPKEWKSFKFKVQYHGCLIHVCITKDKIMLIAEYKQEGKMPIIVKGKKHLLVLGREYSFQW